MPPLRRLCFLLPLHFSTYMGGAEYQASLVLDALCKKNGYDIYYLCRRLRRDFVAKGYSIQEVGSANALTKFGNFFDAPTLYRTLKKIRPQVIYQRVGCAYTGIAARYAKKYGARLIWHISSDRDVAPRPAPNLKTRLIRIINRRFLDYGIRNAHTIIAQTQHQSHLLQNNFGRNSDQVIYNGHPLPQTQIKKSKRISVMWISNLKPLKQPEIFVRLAKDLRGENNVRFSMMGRFESETWFKPLLTQLQKLPNFECLGEVPQEEVNRRLGQGHILVNTSTYEGFPNTFIQAWMRKVPVVSLNVDPDRILSRQRIGFHSKTYDQLVTDVTRLINDQTIRQKMGDMANRYAIHNHSAKTMIAKVITLFEGAFQNHRDN